MEAVKRKGIDVGMAKNGSKKLEKPLGKQSHEPVMVLELHVLNWRMIEKSGCRDIFLRYFFWKLKWWNCWLILCSMGKECILDSWSTFVRVRNHYIGREVKRFKKFFQEKPLLLRLVFKCLLVHLYTFFQIQYKPKPKPKSKPFTKPFDLFFVFEMTLDLASSPAVSVVFQLNSNSFWYAF